VVQNMTLPSAPSTGIEVLEDRGDSCPGRSFRRHSESVVLVRLSCVN